MVPVDAGVVPVVRAAPAVVVAVPVVRAVAGAVPAVRAAPAVAVATDGIPATRPPTCTRT